MSTTVIVADDHPIVVAGIEAALAAHAFEVLGNAHDPDSLFALLATTPCSVVVTDLSMPGGVENDGLAMIRRLRRDWPAMGVVVLTMLTNPAVLRTLLDLGVGAVFDKRASMRDLPVAIHSASVGRTYLSPSVRRLFQEADCADASGNLFDRLSRREVEVMRVFATGMSLNEIAATMRRSFKTISRQKRMAMVKLGLVNDAQLYHYLGNMSALALEDPYSPLGEKGTKAASQSD
ncbi:two-component system capsular synthesis response regulator RcsB [Luteibacter rhizovicinus]|uniref:Two-component system capsular synthesis response regulator RcsB n=1 Tax=Luteibacter rhizovicinus TaxID=242606 RepID=A0A4R3Z0K7_9GAMM|nr:response regulator [Luteibacter rhizovicinus]TCV97243.1 two-component system capsular synthesis response regulator RcsB [Luteibacter rhizovicinus]